MTPLFPFGYGLSYSAFDYSALKLKRSGDGGLDVSFRVKNTGKYAGDEVPQIYLGAPKDVPSGVQFAVKSLAAFDRVTVAAGQSRDVTIHVPARQLQYWSVADNGWKFPTGTRTVFVGASSRDVRVQADLDMAAR